MSPTPSPGRFNLAAAWRLDVATAQAELEATQRESDVLAAHACAWRITAITLPVALVVTSALAVRGGVGPAGLLLAIGLAALGPQVVAFVLTFPASFLATLQASRHRSHDARLRFGTILVYNYYGWRYAFRGRRRPWGALTRAEQVAANPRRAGVRAEH